MSAARRILGRLHGESGPVARATVCALLTICACQPAAAQNSATTSSAASAPTSGPASRFDSPPRDFDFIHMDLALTFTEEDIAARRMHGVVTHQIRPRGPKPAELRLNAVDMSIENVTLLRRFEGARASSDSGGVLINLADAEGHEFEYDGRELRIRIPEFNPAAQEFLVAVRYRVENPKRGLFFVLPTADEPDRPTVVYTNAEPLQARYWVPCHDWPDTRWTSTLTFNVPPQLTAISVGQPDAASRRWNLSTPTDPHLLGFAVGEFAALQRIEPGAGGTRFDAIVRRGPYVVTGAGDAAAHTLRDVPHMIRFYESLTGIPFPYPQYTHVTIPTHFHGGMEHAGFSMIDPALLSTGRRGNVPEERTTYNYVAHMLAHMWFAGIVNYRHVREAWLNEAFATYLHQNWYTQAEGPDAFVNEMQRTVDLIARFDRPGRSTPLVPPTLASAEAVYGFGGGLVYWKGAWVLHMLRHELGHQTFWRGVKQYLETNRLAAATTADLQAAFEHVAGRPLEAFFNQWVHRDGIPTLEVAYAWEESRRAIVIHVQQNQRIDAENPPFDVPLEFAWRNGDVERRERVVVRDATTEFAFPCDAEPALFCADPEGALLATLREAKPAGMWRAQLREGPTALSRARAAEALRREADAETIAALAAALHNRREFRGVRQRAAQALGAAAPDGAALKALLQVEHDGEAPHPVHEAVIDALARFPNAATAYRGVMRRTGGDQHIVVQAVALRALPAFEVDPRGFDAVAAAAAAALPGNSLYVRDVALDVLEELADPGAAALLLPALDRIASEKVARAERLIALLAKLAAASDVWRPKVAARLAELLTEPRPTVRAAAARGMGKLGDDEALAALQSLAERDDVERVRDAAAAAVSAIQSRLEAAE